MRLKRSKMLFLSVLFGIGLLQVSAQPTSDNTTPITIPAIGTATPYSSDINVSGLTGNVLNVSVSLSGFSHTFPSDVGILLVSPSGASVNLMSECGGGTDAVNANLTFDDAAPNSIPSSIVSGDFRPTQCSSITYSPPAPAAPYGTTLSVLNGGNPNGTWKLFVQDFFSGDSGSISGGWSISIVSGTSPGSLQFFSAAYSGNENTTASVTVRRTTGLTGAVTVDYATADGTAIGGAACGSGIDYVSTSGTLTFGNGISSQTFSVQLCPDVIIDPNETINLSLSNPTGGASLGTPDTAILTIIDITPTFQFSSATYSVAENQSTITLPVTRGGTTTGTQTVSYATSDGTAIGGTSCAAGVDYISNSGTLNVNNSIPITITICNDAVIESSKTFNVTLSNPTGGAIVFSPGAATVTIQDDDLPPSFLTVNSADDVNDGVCDTVHCSLREAIAAAAVNNTTIGFSTLFNTPRTIVLTNGSLVINKSLVINGTSAKNVTISGNNTSRIFTIAAATGNFLITLSNLTMTNGYVPELPTDGTNGGGAISHETTGTLTVNNCVISNNSTPGHQELGGGGGIYNRNGTLNVNNSTITGNSTRTDRDRGGAGIMNFSGTVSISKSTISNNSANLTVALNREESGDGFAPEGDLNGGGGAILNRFGTMTISNSTVSGNTSNNPLPGSFGGYGAGVKNVQGMLTVLNCTITDNTAISGAGGGLSTNGNTTVKNTIVAGNFAAAVLSDIGGTFTSQGSNFIGTKGAATGFTNGVNGDQVGTDASPIDAKLAPLGFYGGTTQTHALLQNSTAINNGNSAGSPATDQRGATRVGNPDIGAFELNNDFNNGGSAYVANLPNGTLNTGYSQTLVPDIVLNGNTFSYSVTAGSLPAGLSLSTNFAPQFVVALNGTPTQSGTFTFTVTASGNGASVDTNYTISILAPTAAYASVTGRVLTAKGRGIIRAVVVLENVNTGEIKQVLTNNFGNFSFKDLPSGDFYVLSVSRTGYHFDPNHQGFQLNDSLEGLNIIGTLF